jgi:hypothetical protein
MSETEETDQLSPQPASQKPQTPTGTQDAEPNFKPMPPSNGYEPNHTFVPVYTGLETDVEVELIKRVPASESDRRFGHAIIDRPEWDNPRKTPLQNIRVDVVDEEGTDG